MRKIRINVGKRWFIVYTNGLYPEQLEKFKKIIGNPMKTDWYIFPSEYVEKVELIGRWKLGDYIQAIVKKIKRWLSD